MTARPARRRPTPGGCPVCGKPAPAGTAFVPFCSGRCKMVDLGRWLTGDYVIAGEDAIQLDPEELEGYLQRLEADKRAAAGDDEDDGNEEQGPHDDA